MIELMSFLLRRSLKNLFVMAHKCFGRAKWGDKSLWNRQDVAIQAYLFIPRTSANYGAWRVACRPSAGQPSESTRALAADRRWRRRSPWPQQGAILWFSRHLCNKTSKMELFGLLLLFTPGGLLSDIFFFRKPFHFEIFSKIFISLMN